MHAGNMHIIGSIQFRESERLQEINIEDISIGFTEFDSPNFSDMTSPGHIAAIRNLLQGVDGTEDNSLQRVDLQPVDPISRELTRYVNIPGHGSPEGNGLGPSNFYPIFPG